MRSIFCIALSALFTIVYNMSTYGPTDNKWTTEQFTLSSRANTNARGTNPTSHSWPNERVFAGSHLTRRSVPVRRHQSELKQLGALCDRMRCSQNRKPPRRNDLRFCVPVKFSNFDASSATFHQFACACEMPAITPLSAFWRFRLTPPRHRIMHSIDRQANRKSIAHESYAITKATPN